MERPKRKANTISGSQKVIAPVAGMPKRAFEPWPSCQNQVSRPKVAASEIRFMATAFTASTSERNARVSSSRVASATRLNISGKLPKTAWL